MYNPASREALLNDDNKDDNENISLALPGLDGPLISEPKPFAPDQMVRCDECLRANGPTRVNCLYCGAALPFNESLANLQKPALRPLEKWEQGYNNIILPISANLLSQDQQEAEPVARLNDNELAEAADLLRLAAADLARIISLNQPLPLARASTMDEAALVQRRLTRLRIDTVIIPDADLGVEEAPPVRVRAIAHEPDGFIAFQTPENPGASVAWSSLSLAVVGRLVVKRVELREQNTARAENRILDANEFFTDESTVEFYVSGLTTPYRISANSFDFSCLGGRKSYVAGENLRALIDLFRERAPQLECDESYNSVRKALEAVWPSQRQHESGGWRRDRPGKYSIGSATELSNESQFLRYSRLRHYFGFRSKERNDEGA